MGSNEEEVADSQGIMIRRRPSTGPPLHYVGPFEFRIQSEGNTPRNILEEIVWNKDIEVTQVLSWFLNRAFFCLTLVFVLIDVFKPSRPPLFFLFVWITDERENPFG